MPALGAIFFAVTILGLIGLAVGSVLIAAPCVAAGGALIWFFMHPYSAVKERYAALAQRCSEISFPSPTDFHRAMIKLFLDELAKEQLLLPCRALTQVLFDTVDSLYAQEDFRGGVTMPLPPDFQWKLKPDYQYLSTRLDEIETRLSEFSETQRQFAALCIDMLIVFTQPLRRASLRTWEQFRADIDSPPTFMTVAAYDGMNLPASVAQRIGYRIWNAPSGLLRSTLTQYRDNVRAVSREHFSDRDFEEGKRVFPNQYVGSPSQIVKAYFAGTVWYEPFMTPVPFAVRKELRPEHGVIVAASGGGKTQLLENLILADLMENDPPGMIVIDLKNHMIQRIAKLDVFHPDHGRLRDRLIFIDPLDSPALNVFDIGDHPTEEQIGAATESLRAFMRGVLEEPLTGQMNVIFTAVMAVVLRRRGSTFATFLDVIENPLRYRETIDMLPPGQQSFMLQYFSSKEGQSHYQQTKMGIITRLYQMRIQSKLEDMFGAPRNALDLPRALNEGKIILVSTDPNGIPGLSAIFGRYFISLAVAAGLTRRPGKSATVHLYIDEAGPYVDESTELLLTRLREFGLGSIFAFQEVRQMGKYVSTFLGNTASKFMGNVPVGDAQTFAQDMRTETEFIMAQRPEPIEPPTYADFAFFERGLTRAVSVRVPIAILETFPSMREADYQRLRAQNRARVRGDAIETSPASLPPPTPPPGVDTGPPDAWG